MKVRGEITYDHLRRLQRSDESLTVVIRSAHFTAEGMERLGKIAQLSQRHRFVLALPALSVRQGVASWAEKLECRRNVFIGFVGKGVSRRSRVFKSLKEAYDDLIERATPAPSVGHR